MSWDHGTYGWEQYENILSALRQRGIAYEEGPEGASYSHGADVDGESQKLRAARFMNTDGKSMIVEEYLAVEDNDCDGRNLIGIAIYEEGRTPNFTTLVLDPA